MTPTEPQPNEGPEAEPNVAPEEPETHHEETDEEESG
jgi:hypothetical protein